MAGQTYNPLPSIEPGSYVQVDMPPGAIWSSITRTEYACGRVLLVADIDEALGSFMLVITLWHRPDELMGQRILAETFSSMAEAKAMATAHLSTLASIYK